MYGLVAVHGRDAGMPIQKPWRVACSPNSCLPSLLNQRCDGSHAHTPCAGRNTLLTQGYTPRIVDLVHKSISDDIARMNSVTKEYHADGSFKHDSVIHYKERAHLCVGIEEMSESIALAALV